MSGARGRFALSGMSLLAVRNLLHDKVRLAVTLTGIIFALVLIAVQMGLFFGFVSTTSGIIDHTKVDLWITSHGVPFLEHAPPLSERKVYQVLATPGVAAAEKYIVHLMNWKRPDGSERGVLLVGFNTETARAAPWNVSVGQPERMRAADSVFVDNLYRDILGVSEVGHAAEMNGRRARIVGFTNGIRSFTTSPYVFTSFRNAQKYAGLNDDQTLYILVTAAPGVDPQALKRDIAARVQDVDVYTTREFANKTQFYWLFTTGAGFTVLIAALLGWIVGIVIVSQTIYATTVDHIREYGTLKAIGASNGYLYSVILKQALLSAVAGYAVAMCFSYGIVYLSRNAGAAILLPLPMAIGMFVLALVMCASASMVSISTVTRIDPALVFKG
jgi:putative ABC transport system permease protein